MKWIGVIIIGLAALAGVIAGIGATLPRAHRASRTLRVKRTPAEVWPVLLQATQSSDVPVDVLESQPPHRLVTRVTEKEQNFGGTWTIVVAPQPAGTDLTITEDGWVANPIFRFVSRFIIGHHATMDGMLKKIAADLNENAALTGE